MRRPLPSAAETAAILGRKRTRPARRAAPTAGRTLAPYLKALNARYGAGPGALAARWDEIVGPELARRTEPVKLSKPRGGGPAALELKVAPGAALLIQHQAADLVGRVNLFLGAGAVGKLRIVQGVVKPRAASAAPARPRRSTAPLDAGAEAELAQGLAAVRDDGLRAALLKLGRGVRRG